MSNFLLSQKARNKQFSSLLIVLFISTILVFPACVAFYRRIWTQNNNEQKSIALLPELLRFRRNSKQVNIVNENTDRNDSSDDYEPSNEAEEYENEWVAQIMGGTRRAKNVAKAVGYKYIAPVRGFKNIYIFSKEKHRKKRKADNKSTLALRHHKLVIWAEQQKSQKRFKRDMSDAIRSVASTDNNFSCNIFNDPFWPQQWNLQYSLQTNKIIQRNSRTLNGELISMNVIEAWQLGYTGKGVVVTILDDGLQHNHSDIVRNYDPKASYDLNDNDSDPMPTFNELNSHGTRCAGEVAMTPNNSICGVGIAYDAKIGGIRMLDGKITDRMEAEALSYNIHHIDIYSASWGPKDDGKTVEGPGKLAQKAILKGIQQGRGGKGVIYVWASGNGGLNGDGCDCDGYIDNIYTFSVSSVSEDGTFPWYAEKCTAVLSSTYSNGYQDKRQITTTDIQNKCTTNFSGTSASAPMAAAIIALGLDANPLLTWRDVQHIAVWTSNPVPLLGINEGWTVNARGLLVNSRFGFGIMDAEAFVKAAKTWQNVAEQNACITIFPNFSKRKINNGSVTVIKFQTDSCEGKKNEVNFLEHVQLVLDVYYPVRGHLAISITSPQGTKAQLLSVRREDKSNAGFYQWPFMSVHTWGENPRGIWELHVQDKSMSEKAMTGIVNNITIITYGTVEEPKHYKAGKRYKTNNGTVLNDQILKRDVSIFWDYMFVVSQLYSEKSVEIS
ncbi:unnamed protein product [Thelazia callipaeda]|uniref:P/Homo B domain-containing protein n=1 Tax=Thelazia callipaeda TaxID=103827 RepID=A0A0N5CWA5_THECL|nr:unnamed protein product [Thelazia callipaeda]